MATVAIASASRALLLFSPFRNPIASCKIPKLPSSIRANYCCCYSTQSQSPPSGRRNVIDILQQRGLLESLTSPNLHDAVSSCPVKVYCGFDPTAESLHLGNLLGLIVLSWFQRCGHHAIALIGGATARIGDPSGKSLERPELDADTLQKNTVGIHDTIYKILCTNPENFVILNNYDWWKEVRLLDFLRNVGRYARVGTMMAKESVKKRLESEQGMSYTEFTYQLLQCYDFLYLFEKEGVISGEI